MMSNVNLKRIFAAACLATAAVLIDFGDIHACHHADSFVPILESLYRWEPYYWEQNRYGTLVALLAVPVKHPLANLLVQNGITLLCGVFGVALGVRYLFRRACAPALGLFTTASFIALAPLQFQWIYASTFNVFSTSLCLGLLGLIALERRSPLRYFLAAVCFLTASWVNTAIGAVLLPLASTVALVRHTTCEYAVDERLWQRRSLLVPALYNVGATVAAVALQRLAPVDYHNTHFEAPPIHEWWPQLREMATTFYAETQPAWWLLAVGTCLAFVLNRAWRSVPGSRARRTSMLVVGTVVAAMTYVVLMGILFDGRWRYAAPGLVLVHAAAVAGALQPLVVRLPSRTLVAAACLFAVVPIQHGRPSLQRVMVRLQTDWQVGYRDVVDANCTHVAGDYWRVWPSVFAANWRAYDLGGREPIWGVSHRSTPTAGQWQAVPNREMRVAAFNHDVRTREYLQKIRAEWREPEPSGSLLIYVPEHDAKDSRAVGE